MATTAIDLSSAQLGIPIPVAYGPAAVRGNLLLQHEKANKNRIVVIGLGAGEWAGADLLWVNSKLINLADTTLFHFHGGRDGDLAVAIAATSLGGDQQGDQFFTLVPSMGARTYSRLAYMMLNVPPDAGAPSATLSWYGHFRTMMVRQFSNVGAQTSYAYSTNYSWIALDLIIRTVLKREAVIGAALTASEKTRIDFASFKDTADYNDEVVAPQNEKRFFGGFNWVARTPLGTALQQLCVASRSYIGETGGVIWMRPDKPRASVFIMREHMIAPGSFKPAKTKLRGAQNQITGIFRDLRPASVVTIATIARAANVVTITVAGAGHPFQPGDDIEPFAVPVASFNAPIKVTWTSADLLSLRATQTGINESSVGGSIGTPASRYGIRTCVVSHENHQRQVGARGLGISSTFAERPLNLDLGVTRFGQVNRIMKFEKTRALGVDQTPYFAPPEATVEIDYRAVDENDKPAICLEPGDRLTVDKSISEEYQGDYEVMLINKKRSGGRGSNAGGGIELELLKVVDEAYTDSEDPDAPIVAVRTGDGIGNNGGVANASYRPVGNPLAAHDAGTTSTIDVALTMRITGLKVDLIYDSKSLTGLAFRTLVWVYVFDPNRGGGSCPMISALTRDDKLLDQGYMLVGSIITPVDGGPDTIGNEDGGTFQPGRTYTLIPGTFTNVNFQNAPYAFNANDNDGATCDVATGEASLEYGDFGGSVGLYTEATLRHVIEVTSLQAGAQIKLSHSENGGLSWLSDGTITAAAAKTTYPIALPPGVNTGKVKGRVIVPGPVGVKTSAPTPSDGGGALPWTITSNGGERTKNATSGNYTTNTLNFVTGGMGVPAGAVITGCRLTTRVNGTYIDDSSSGDLLTVSDSRVQLQGTGVVGANVGTFAPLLGYDQTLIYGGSGSSIMGALTDVKVNNATFGFALEYSFNFGMSVPSLGFIGVTSALLEVFYSLGATHGVATYYSGELVVKQ